MRYKSLLGVVLLALVLTVAACAPPATPAPSPTDAPTEESSVADFPTPTVEVFEAMPEDSTEEQPQAAMALAHADAPASSGEYRFDDSSFVGATGSPQLVEFFTTW